MVSPQVLRIVLIGILILTGITLYSQVNDKYITGKVVDRNMSPITLATVSLHDRNDKLILSTSTDSLGQFNLRFGVKGKYFVKVSHVGDKDYQSAIFELIDVNLGTLKLLPLENILEEATVEGRKKTVQVDGGTFIYNVENTLGGQDVSVLEALKRAPGVFVENESDITLNGKSGVQILLDGRQTFLSGKELTDLLKSLSSNNLKSIEIINSPTAKYEATGAAGIININTKKNQVRGLNGNVSTAVAYGISAKQLQNATLNYRVDKLNIFANYSHTLGNYHYLYGTNRQQNGKAYNSHTKDVDKRQKMSSQVGIDYYLNDKNTIGFLANGNFIFGGGITDTRTEISTLPSLLMEESLDAINDYYGQRTARYNFNFNYKYEDTLGRSLNLDADYGFFDKWNKNLQSNIYRDHQQNILQENLYRTLNGIDIDLKGIKIDYGMNLWQGKLETGFKYSNVGSKNNARFFHVDKGPDSLDNRRTNDFHFDEHTTSAYLDYKRTLGKWSLQGGVRIENSNSKGTLFYNENGAELDDDIKRNFTNLFPFFSATRPLGENQTVSLSYAKRIERPAYQDLNPFIYMLDELSFWQGNPFLSPSLTHRLTVLYSLRSATVVSFNFAYTDQLNAKVTDTLDNDKIVMISRNVGIQKHWSLSLTQNFTPKFWWDLTFNGLLYFIQNDVSFDQYRNLNLQQAAGRVSLVQSFRLPLKMRAEVTAVYNSNRLSGANTISREISQVDVAFQKILLNDKATIRFAINDIYKGNQSKYTQNFPGFVSNSYGYYESRQVRLSFSYRFSSGTTKAQRTRKSALENESGRIQ
ncbi:TonB-dependent receptor [Sphingobacterium sp. JUb56]|uniref:TonB-dependent receptor n=1 Tax=Sphingobacterium sp. JUb56 TaxID=2587145 RepID=UPI0016099E66|nr:TonB-dependent receptor [Sphingobacterium sp. JUb56]MBB2954130.1 hypothetical protein [Sphingobacterium sp. JUb56]